MLRFAPLARESTIQTSWFGNDRMRSLVAGTEVDAIEAKGCNCEPWHIHSTFSNPWSFRRSTKQIGCTKEWTWCTTLHSTHLPYPPPPPHTRTNKPTLPCAITPCHTNASFQRVGVRLHQIQIERCSPSAGQWVEGDCLITNKNR